MSVRTIVVGIDGSQGSRRALEWACALASQLDARAVLVHAFEPLSHLGELAPPYDFVAAEQEARTLLEGDWSAPARDAGLDADIRLRHGVPHEVIIDTADDAGADLIVVGTRGLGTFRGMALGSTSLKLTHTSRRPVTIVPVSDVEPA